MAFNLERFVKCKINYKNCSGNQTKGEVTFDFGKNSVVFAIDRDHYSNTYSEKVTLSVEDLRALVTAYDAEKAKLPPEVEKPCVERTTALWNDSAQVAKRRLRITRIFCC